MRRLGLLVAGASIASSQWGCQTIDPGQDLQLAEVVFDENFYYCRVEPILFNQSCGPGDSAQGDPGNGCHFNVTTFRLTDYTMTGAPLVADSCGDSITPGATPPPDAQRNYQSAQLNMRRDPDQAPLLLRPTEVAAHPRQIFALDSPDADVIREWATRFSSQ